MENTPGYKFDIQRLARRIREKRGTNSLRDISAQIGVSIATLSRVERAKLPPDYHNLGILCYWLGDNPAEYFILEEGDNNDLTVQLRAAHKVSEKTADAFMEIIRAAYAEVLAQAADDEKA
ncbi:hypothetical protein ANRL1_03315 [Anaerolineae bacterium]|nr:hypothetical protein ANRL1_03315 [Anaerolineae bacterium]